MPIQAIERLFIIVLRNKAWAQFGSGDIELLDRSCFREPNVSTALRVTQHRVTQHMNAVTTPQSLPEAPDPLGSPLFVETFGLLFFFGRSTKVHCRP